MVKPSFGVGLPTDPRARPHYAFACRADCWGLSAGPDKSADAVWGMERHGMWTKAKPLASPKAHGFAVSGLSYSAARRQTLQCNVKFAAAQHSLCTCQGLSGVMLLSKAWGKRRVSACASLHHCHWDWHSGRICTVIVITRGGERDSFGPNALTCSARQKAAWE
jgi:hypothetical protein